jgi:hypothetical protein
LFEIVRDSLIQNFNIDGSNGWDINNGVLDVGYYEELVGGSSATDPIEVLVNDAPPWRRIVENGVNFWVAFPNNVRVVMVRKVICGKIHQLPAPCTTIVN